MADPALAALGGTVNSLAAHTGVDLAGPLPEVGHDQRIAALENELVAGEAAAPEVPAEQLTTKQLLLRLTDNAATMRNDLTTMRNDLTTVRNDLTTALSGQAAIMVKIDNIPRRNHNLNAPVRAELMPLAVESNAVGAPLLGTMPPAGLFPVPFTKEALYNLTVPQIEAIRAFYMYAPHEAGALVHQRRLQLLLFLGVVPM